MNKKLKELLKVTGAAALTLAVATAAFLGANSVAYAAATQPEDIPKTTDVKSAYTVVEVPNSGFQEPKLNVVWDDNEGNSINQPKTGAMPYEEAAQIGAEYIYDLFGESIDGKTVEMLYSSPEFSSRAHWHGTVANSAEDLKLPDDIVFELEEGSTVAAGGFARETLYDFSIDAVTGERISIYSHFDTPLANNLGEGKSYSRSPVELEAMQYEAPANVSEYAEAARAFAQKHFNQTRVVSVEFVRISLNPGDRKAAVAHAKAYQEAYEEDKNKPFNFTLYDAGRSITFNVTDDTGRAALVSVYMDTTQAVNLDSSGSDFIPGYSFEGEGGVG